MSPAVFRTRFTIRRWMAFVVLASLPMGGLADLRARDRWRDAMGAARFDYRDAIRAREVAEIAAIEYDQIVRSGGADASAFSDLRAEVETARGREAAKKAACERLEAATPWSIRLIWGVYAFNRFAQGFRP